MQGIRRGEAELEQLLEQADEAVSEAELEWEAESGRSAEVVHSCRQAGQIADRLRQAIRRARAGGHPFRRDFAIANIRRRGAAWVNRISNQMLPILGRFHPNDLDLLVGCLARVEHAIGGGTVPLQRLKAAVRQRLGMP
jgi:hypothetical protein